MIMRPAQGYPNYYVHPDGKIWSVKKRRWLKQSISGKGYLAVALDGGGFTERRLVHRLVAQVFVDNPNNREVVNHIDGNKKNNCRDNLEWCTLAENIRHHRSKGLVRMLRGSNHPLTKLTETDVANIRRMYAEGGVTYGQIALAYRISKMSVARIIKGVTWNQYD